MTFLPDYSYAIAALGFWAVFVSLLSAISTIGRGPERSPCGKPVRDYDNPVYRRERAFMNAVESTGPFMASTLAAMFTGAMPFYVNLLASVFILARLAMAFVHICTTNQAARSGFYLVGFVCVLLLSGIAVVVPFASP